MSVQQLLINAAVMCNVSPSGDRAVMTLVGVGPRDHQYELPSAV